MDGRQTGLRGVSSALAGQVRICACGQPVNECPSATLCSQPKGIMVQQTMLLWKIKNVFIVLFQVKFVNCTNQMCQNIR